MKKITCTSLCLAVLISLSGCFGVTTKKETPSESTVTITNCVAVVSYGTVKYTITSDEDRISKEVLTNVLDYEKMNLTLESATELLEQYDVAYALDGVTHEYTIEGSEITEIITIDFVQADWDELTAAGLISSEEGQSITYISLDVTVQNIKDLGGTCSTE